MLVSAVPPDVVAAAAAAARAWLRMPDGDEEPALAGLAAGAIELAEAFCRRVLVRRGVEEVLPAGAGGWQALLACPVVAITQVTAAGGGAALPVEGYRIDIDAAGIGWLRLAGPVAAGGVAVGYVAGEAAGWDGLPPAVAQGIVLLVAHLWDRQAGEAVPPAAVAALWRPWRRLGLAAAWREGGA